MVGGGGGGGINGEDLTGGVIVVVGRQSDGEGRGVRSRLRGILLHIIIRIPLEVGGAVVVVVKETLWSGGGG